MKSFTSSDRCAAARARALPLLCIGTAPTRAHHRVASTRREHRQPANAIPWALAGSSPADRLRFAGVAQGAGREGFDFSRNALSQLALGEAGWVQTVNFLLAGTMLGYGWGQSAPGAGRGPGGAWGPVLSGVFGASFWAAAVFRADAGAGFPAGAPDVTVMSGHGAVHMAVGMVGYLALWAAPSCSPARLQPGATAGGPWPRVSSQSPSSLASPPLPPPSWPSQP
ncbi:DUF998 domain-containing protein [Streptomyces sp. A1547]|uniref:DUF998 domain-containing protein n=1 Tax=Streptomyces sp. A1547 TaxID=2563105 RepID=UPI001F0EB271|nr:DUF998 domain-containing protein [Streptomyces sp. A1547]